MQELDDNFRNNVQTVLRKCLSGVPGNTKDEPARGTKVANQLLGQAHGTINTLLDMAETYRSSVNVLADKLDRISGSTELLAGAIKEIDKFLHDTSKSNNEKLEAIGGEIAKLT